MALDTAQVSEQLLEIEDGSASKKAAKYTELLTNILANSGNSLAANLIAYVDSLLGDSLNVVAARPILSTFISQFRTIQSNDIKTEVGKHTIELLAPKVVSYEEQDTAIKYAVAEAYEEEQEYSESAKILQKISLDSSQRTVSADDKAKLWIRIVRCYVEEEDPTSALSYLNRIKNVIYEVTDKETILHFQLNQAKILDSQRSFLDASAAYHAISQETTVDEGERLKALSEAMKCAVLAPAGPLRGRTLAKLYKDDRADSVEEHGILEKIFLDRLLSPEEVTEFREKLAPHQLAKTSDGSTVLDKAVLEHNLLAASKLYSNIGIDQLGLLLGVEGDKAEEYAAKMVEQGRLAGYIDQIDRFIFFEGEGTGDKLTAHKDAVVGREMRKWDANVQGLAEEVEKVTTMVQNSYPEFYAETMVN
ncbi:COP9 signalosome-like protein complex subunit 4 [Venturia nashicola]|uniref:COP9 signalosome complex subunit 4 n=1 Tax=Venturia nashicola TaxID=86259 RepID=A0A4Z1NRW6_9PEZI|nr:COP9 signalosome-like protein complex subunit 4 [Venturia nashicola]TLD26296.1 COP9 signalosome-like protein complex subunit 4 [Venturia nashicola]